MDIVARLKKFINDRQIQVTAFADECGIPRPTLSQLLNGRNKKVSNELIQKIHQAYPELSVLWLMFGEGPMYADGTGSAESDTPQSLVNGMGEIVFDFNDIDTNETEISDTNQPSGENLNIKPEPIKRSIDIDGSKTIVNIIVYYSDNSFESFGPK